MTRENSSRLTERDLQIVANVDRALADGIALKRAWERAEAAGSYEEQFSLTRGFNQPVRSIGFFDRFPLSDGSELPVMGIVQQMPYDQRKQAPAAAVRDEFREFICRYFLRVSDFREPQAYVNETRRAPRGGLGELLSWCADERETRRGFGYTQMYYKLRDTGEVGKFRRRDECAIVDVRKIGTTYDWLVVKVRIFDFRLRFEPFGPGSLSVSIPLEDETYVVLSPEFITVTDNTTGSVIGSYGFGYALLQVEQEPGRFAYGPGHFRAGFQLVTFQVHEDGATSVTMVFVANRPEQILRVDLDPVGWSFRAADLLTFGLASRAAGPLWPSLERSPVRLRDIDPVTLYIQAADALTAGFSREELCISKKQLERDMLLQHFMEHYRLIAGSLLTWRQVPDWLAADLPDTALTGLGS